jgi:hypothetical protein
MKRRLVAVSRRQLSRRQLSVRLGAVLIGAAVAASGLAAIVARDLQQSPTSIAVVGDQYTAGFQNRVVWPTLLAQRTGWRVSNFALPGAGFVADGGGGHGFTYQMDRAAAAHPDIILIVGGINDTSVPDPARIEIGAIDAINKAILRRQRLLVIGPTWYERPVPNSVTAVSDAVKSAARTAGVLFVGALDPPWLTRGQMLPDLAGPTDEGQSMMADKIAGCVRSALGL